jgi:hypothetical protein
MVCDLPIACKDAEIDGPALWRNGQHARDSTNIGNTGTAGADRWIGAKTMGCHAPRKTRGQGLIDGRVGLQDGSRGVLQQMRASDPVAGQQDHVGMVVGGDMSGDVGHAAGDHLRAVLAHLVLEIPFGKGQRIHRCQRAADGQHQRQAQGQRVETPQGLPQGRHT